MLKLYVAPGACSMSCHIALEESKLPFEAIVSPWGDKEKWAQIEKYNPSGAVPVLLNHEGKSLTQNIAILSYIAELAPETGLLPRAGTFERAKAMEWVSWVAADLHKAFGPLFDDEASEEVKKEAVTQVETLLKTVDQHLGSTPLLVGNQFTIADCYLFTVYGWCKWVKISQDHYKNLNNYSAKISERPSVLTVLKREGLLK